MSEKRRQRITVEPREILPEQPLDLTSVINDQIDNQWTNFVPPFCIAAIGFTRFIWHCALPYLKTKRTMSLGGCGFIVTTMLSWDKSFLSYSLLW